MLIMLAAKLTNFYREVRVTKEQYEAWRGLPETQEIVDKVNAEVKFLAERLANGNTLDMDSASQTAMMTAKMVGQILGTTFILDDLWDNE